jgi:hypothetical protein
MALDAGGLNVEQRGNDDRRAALVVSMPPHYPTPQNRELVEHLTACGLDVNQIARALRATPDDVRKYYSDEMTNATAMVNTRVMSAVLHKALYEGDIGAAKLWLINKAGWRSGDGPRVGMSLNINPLTGQPLDSGETDQLTVVQRREVITKVLTMATKQKRADERVIEATPVKKSNGTKQ